MQTIMNIQFAINHGKIILQFDINKKTHTHKMIITHLWIATDLKPQKKNLIVYLLNTWPVKTFKLIQNPRQSNFFRRYILPEILNLQTYVWTIPQLLFKIFALNK
jgi:hypothetical protein